MQEINYYLIKNYYRKIYLWFLKRPLWLRISIILGLFIVYYLIIKVWGILLVGGVVLALWYYGRKDPVEPVINSVDHSAVKKLTGDMEVIYKRSFYSLASMNPLSYLNPMFYVNFYVGALTYQKNFIRLTSKEVILHKGILRTNTVFIKYDKINSIRIRKGILGKKHNFGDVIIMSGNDVVGETIIGVKNPEMLKAQLELQMDHHEDSTREQKNYQPSAVNHDYLVELEKLSELKDKGIITVDEFLAKKKKLLKI